MRESSLPQLTPPLSYPDCVTRVNLTLPVVQLPTRREWGQRSGLRPKSGVDHLVNRKLLDVGWPLRLDSCGRESFHDPRREGVEVGAGLPEVDDSPSTIDRPRCVEEEPLRCCAVRVGVIVSLVELLLGDAWELDADADSHRQPFFR